MKLKKSDLRKTWNQHVIVKKSHKNLLKNLGQSYEKLMKNLRRVDDITGILPKRKICGK